MKRVLITLSCALMGFYSSICAAQPTLAPAAEKLQQKLLKAAVAPKPERLSNFRVANTIRVPLQETQYIWDAEEDDWMPIVHNTYTYTDQGLWQSITARSLPENELEDRTNITYNAQGMETSSIHQIWDGTTWVNVTRSRHEYDESGEVGLIAQDQWANNSWQLASGMRFTNTTGAGGRVEQSLTERYTPESGWENSSRTIYGYNGSGTNPVSSTTSEWVEGAWVEMERSTEITYENGQIKSSIDEFYDDEEEQWTKMQNTYTYTTDAANQTMTILIESAMEMGEMWMPFMRTTIIILSSGETYLGAQSFSEIKSEYNLGAGWEIMTHLIADITRDENGSITEIVARNYDMESEEYENLTRFVYSDFVNLNTTSAENEVLAAALQLYPNPTHDNLRIALDLTKVQGVSLSIHNLTGQKVYELASLRGETVVDLGHLPSGVYMVRVTGTNKAGITRKIVKQ